MTVLKLIFERIESETDTSHIQVNISSLIRGLLQLLHAAPKEHPWAMRIRVKFCVMAHNLFEKRDYLALEKELMLRGDLLEAFAEWAMIELPVSVIIYWAAICVSEVYTYDSQILLTLSIVPKGKSMLLA